MDKANKLAHHEIEWWKAHHRRDKEFLVDEMTKLYKLQFGIKGSDAKKAVLHRVEAAKWHDQAEEHEDKGDQKMANVFWEKAEQSLHKHFLILERLK